VDPVEYKQKSGLRFGATHSVAATDQAAELVRDLTYGVMADSVIVSPSIISSDDVHAAIEVTRKGGACVLAGMSPQTTRSIKINLQDFILWNKNLVRTVFGSCNPRADIPLSLTCITRGN
jgi:Zn-dependent alcohol dehydrogenase